MNNDLRTVKFIGQHILSRYCEDFSYYIKDGSLIAIKTLLPNLWQQTIQLSSYWCSITNGRISFALAESAAGIVVLLQLYMGQVTELCLSCFLVLLSIDSKTRKQDSRSFVTWPISIHYGAVGAADLGVIFLCSGPLSYSPQGATPALLVKHDSNCESSGWSNTTQCVYPQQYAITFESNARQTATGFISSFIKSCIYYHSSNAAVSTVFISARGNFYVHGILFVYWLGAQQRQIIAGASVEEAHSHIWNWLIHMVYATAGNMTRLSMRCGEKSNRNIINSLRSRQNGRYNADDIFKCIFLNKMFDFRLKFHWNSFLRVQLTIFQLWFW